MPASSYLGMAGAYGSNLPDPLPDDQPTERRRNRSRRFPAEPGGDRGRPAHIIPSSPALPDPHLLVGRRLYLAPGEWSHAQGRMPSEYVLLRVARVLPDEPRVDDRMVWLAGHRVGCRDCAEPCVVLLASVEALWRAVGGR
ncbi:hypothetical protein [Plantactinospora sp. WMMB782]|uniref:hypothetical protein n=1 Tax=Plantactinospora sp. WMMB782 TaxID=3404121 RepID=UPI003B952758